MDVLLVDDEALVREVLAEDLADAGLRVVEASSAEVALLVATAAAGAGQPPRVVVADVDLGAGMDGLALMAEARRRWPDLGVVVMTGQPANLDGRGPDPREVHLHKPFGPNRLTATMHGVMGRSSRGAAGNIPLPPWFGPLFGRGQGNGHGVRRRGRAEHMRVLLTDNDALVLGLLMDTLAEESIEVGELADAEDALVLLGAGQVLDVLVTDIDLGAGLSGLDLASITQERCPTVEVVLINGTSPDPGRASLERHERFLRKPFAPAALADAIRGAARDTAARVAA